MGEVDRKAVIMPPRPRGRALDHRIRIEVPVETVWQVLADVEGWGSWNPIYPEASGSIAPGGRIDLTIALSDMKPQRSPATVYHSIPGRALQFGAPAFGGLLHATRYVELEADGADACTVVNGEAFGRLLGPLLVRMLGARIGDGLRLQNEGLKAAAEALRTSTGRTTSSEGQQ